MKKDITRLLTIITMALMVLLVVNPVNVQARTIKATKTKLDNMYVPIVRVRDKNSFVDEKIYQTEDESLYATGSLSATVYHHDRYYDASQLSAIPQLKTGKQYITFNEGFKSTNTHYIVMFIPDKTGTYQFTCTNRSKNKKVTKNFMGGCAVYQLKQDENGNFIGSASGNINKNRISAYSDSDKINIRKQYTKKYCYTADISTCGYTDGYFGAPFRYPKADTINKYNLEKGKVYILDFHKAKPFKKSVKIEFEAKKVKNITYESKPKYDASGNEIEY